MRGRFFIITLATFNYKIFTRFKQIYLKTLNKFKRLNNFMNFKKIIIKSYKMQLKNFANNKQDLSQVKLFYNHTSNLLKTIQKNN